MMVIKKDGRREEFNINKTKVSIENASEEFRGELNSSDLEIISKDIEKSISQLGNKNTSSYEIIGATISILNKNGFKNVALEYVKNNLS
ncbi:ATP cone domain-containing protein [Clostridium frigidicarnis]|uniref:ATP cone domain-containing protein n=1 Tax=Clostridium frigidicarnis TaxID=84698 RepID=A0A1I1B1B4_9CLOT|nr:ATP cone domain-containing protein [Clostridium frigidicarnis]SFB44125.1 ATP cone domain-containing protein [Clostridium frigidicarnis]